MNPSPRGADLVLGVGGYYMNRQGLPGPQRRTGAGSSPGAWLGWAGVDFCRWLRKQMTFEETWMKGETELEQSTAPVRDCGVRVRGSRRCDWKALGGGGSQLRSGGEGTAPGGAPEATRVRGVRWSSVGEWASAWLRDHKGGSGIFVRLPRGAPGRAPAWGLPRGSRGAFVAPAAHRSPCPEETFPRQPQQLALVTQKWWPHMTSEHHLWLLGCWAPCGCTAREGRPHVTRSSSPLPGAQQGRGPARRGAGSGPGAHSLSSGFRVAAVTRAAATRLCVWHPAFSRVGPEPLPWPSPEVPARQSAWWLRGRALEPYSLGSNPGPAM